MELMHQYQLIRCTDILIGYTGAGLQWYAFMKPRTGMMELNFGKSNFKLTFEAIV